MSSAPASSSGSGSGGSGSATPALQQEDAALNESAFQVERRRLQLQLMREKVMNILFELSIKKLDRKFTIGWSYESRA